MPEPYAYFFTLIQASTAAISIVLVFTITIYATRQSIRQDLDMRFEEEIRQMSDAYFNEFDRFSAMLLQTESNSVDSRLLFNAGTQTDQITVENVRRWADKQANEELAAAFGHIIVANFCLESFGASPYIEYKKDVFENLGDHLLEAKESLSSEEVKQTIIQSSETTEEEYKEMQSTVGDAMNNWISISTKNYTIDIVNKGIISNIINYCKWLFIAGVLIPIIFLIYIPPSALDYGTALLHRTLGNTGMQIIDLSSYIISISQLIITCVVVWLSWQLLRQVRDFFNSFNKPKNPMSQDEKMDVIDDMPNISDELFND